MTLSMNHNKVLVIDDDNHVLQIIQDILKLKGYEVLAASDGQNGMDLFARERPGIVLTDIRMPNMSGIEILKAVKESAPVTQVIMFSGAGTTEDVIEALRLGASDYLMKPVNGSLLIHTVRRCSEQYELFRERIHRNEILEKQVKERTAALTKTLYETVKALGLLTEKRDPYTAGHQQRVAMLAMEIGKKLDLGQKELEVIHVAGLLHDIGKVAVPVELLVKPSMLTPDEKQLFRNHPQAGYDIIKDIPFEESLGKDVSIIVLQHHERLDGSGYPRGLTAGELKLESKILSVSDVVEAMSSHRPYRPERGIKRTIEEISKGSGKYYDPDCVAACIEVIDENGNDIKKLFARIASPERR